jgi:geranylgeranyl pyrophosphate synthase
MIMKPELIENFLEIHLERTLPFHPVKEVYQYAVLPGGKLFRPSLVWAILSDLNPELFKASGNAKSSHALLSSAVEFHHTYTLLHDDLPCMDDDLERRGKPCTHIKYGEWQALLTGDGLLNISYQLLAKSNHPRTLELMRYFGWALGPKGLIHGQVMDLSHEMTKSFAATIRTHELKTARLIQVAILGSAILASTKPQRQLEKRLWRFSQLLGINFQLIDDLSELVESNLSEHELDVNPWLKFPKETLSETKKSLERFETLAKELNLLETNSIVKNYYAKMFCGISAGRSNIEKHLKDQVDLAPVLLLLNRFS